MPRLGRYFLPEQPLHVIQRGNNRQANFFDDDDYACYRDWLAEAAAEYGFVVHTCVLMTNHVHLLTTPRDADSLPRAMQSLGRRYVRYVNTRYRRTGTLWEGRYRAAPIDSERYFSAAAGISSSTRSVCTWCAIRASIAGPATARTRGARLIRWRRPATSSTGSAERRPSGRSATGLCSATRSTPASSTSCALRRMAAGRSVMRFKREIAKALGRRVAPLPRGRPIKRKKKVGQSSLL